MYVQRILVIFTLESIDNLTALLTYVCATEISNVYSCLCMCYTAISAELLLFLLE